MATVLFIDNFGDFLQCTYSGSYLKLCVHVISIIKLIPNPHFIINSYGKSLTLFNSKIWVKSGLAF